MSASDGIYGTVQGTVCNETQYRLSKVANANITCLTHGESIGLAVSILLICVVFCPELILCTANCRGFVPQLRCCHHHFSLDWRTSDILSHALPVPRDVV